MKKLSILALSTALIALSGTANAEVRHYFQCKLLDGKTMADLHAVEKDWREAIDAAGFADYKNAVLMPVGIEEMPEGTFFWEGRSPSVERMGAGATWMGESEEGKALDARFDEVSKCEDPTNWSVSEG